MRRLYVEVNEMTKNEIQVLRANILGEMDAYMRETVDDEEYLMEWLAEGVPDGANENDLMEIAEDEEDFTRICKVFGNLLKAFVDAYGVGD
jgi:hypothetical protein